MSTCYIWDRTVRYNTNGTLDRSFGGNGLVTTNVLAATEDVPNSYDYPTQALVQPRDGKIVVLAFSTPVFPANSEVIALVRYKTNGTLDASFDGDGIATVPATKGLSDLAIQSDGRLIVSEGGLSAIRFRTNGSVDTSFGVKGRAAIHRAGIGFVTRSMAVQPDGKIVFAAEADTEPSEGGSANVSLGRLLPSGSVDTAFGKDGIVISNVRSVINNLISWTSTVSLAVQSDGKIVTAITVSPERHAFGLVRFNPNGALDTSFGSRGKFTARFGKEQGEAMAMAIQPKDGRIVVAGNTTGKFTLGLTRHHAITCGGYGATLVGTRKSEVLLGSVADDVIFGAAGNDTILDRAGNDALCGGDGNDKLIGGTGNDFCFGGGDDIAIACVLLPHQSADWGYKLARDYAERYDPLVVYCERLH